jgi:threonine synthase
MVTILDENVHVVAVEGSSDDLDRPIEQLFAMKEFREEFNLCSINSINVARILMQTAHFFYTYLRVCPQADKEINYW